MRPANALEVTAKGNSTFGFSKSEGHKKKDGKHGADKHKALAIMKLVKDDPNFEVFWQRFLTLH